MSATECLPSTDWPTLFRSAPDFGTAIADAPCQADPAAFAPHDAQVSNGGVYLDNVAAHLTQAGQRPVLIAQNPVFSPALPLIARTRMRSGTPWRQPIPARRTVHSVNPCFALFVLRLKNGHAQ